MPAPSSATLAYYAQPGPLTALPAEGPAAEVLHDLPTGVPELVRVVQHNLLHIFWAQAYGVMLTDNQKSDVQIRTAAARLAQIAAADSAPLTVPRAHAQRSVANCRDFSVLLVALLRRQGIPARARCGFGTYFTSGKFEDHWVAEYWDADRARWVMVDAQLDDLQREKLQIAFDPLDVPVGGPATPGFVNGARAWQLCRQDGVDPHRFGIFNLHGLWFVRGNLIRDVAALNKIELLPWDCWGLCEGLDEHISRGDLAFLDQVAAQVVTDDGATVRALYNTDGRLRVPPEITSYPSGPEPVMITLAAEPGYGVH